MVQMILFRQMVVLMMENALGLMSIDLAEPKAQQTRF